MAHCPAQFFAHTVPVFCPFRLTDCLSIFRTDLCPLQRSVAVPSPPSQATFGGSEARLDIAPNHGDTRCEWSCFCGSLFGR